MHKASTMLSLTYHEAEDLRNQIPQGCQCPYFLALKLHFLCYFFESKELLIPQATFNNSREYII